MKYKKIYSFFSVYNIKEEKKKLQAANIEIVFIFCCESPSRPTKEIGFPKIIKVDGHIGKRQTTMLEPVNIKTK